MISKPSALPRDVRSLRRMVIEKETLLAEREVQLTEVACWAHARRNIYEVYESTASPLAKEALERIADLFAIEARINGRPPAERLAVRQQDAVPLLTELKSFFDK